MAGLLPLGGIGLGAFGMPQNFADWATLQQLQMQGWNNQADYFTRMQAAQNQAQQNAMQYQLGLGQNYNNRYATDASYAANMANNATSRYGTDAQYALGMSGYQNQLANTGLLNQGQMDRTNAELAFQREQLAAQQDLANRKFGLVQSMLGNLGGIFGGLTGGQQAAPGINLTTNYGASASYGPPAGQTPGAQTGGGSGSTGGTSGGTSSASGQGTTGSTGTKLRIARGNYNYRRGPKPIRFAGGTGYQRGAAAKPVAR